MTFNLDLAARNRPPQDVRNTIRDAQARRWVADVGESLADFAAALVRGTLAPLLLEQPPLFRRKKTGYVRVLQQLG